MIKKRILSMLVLLMVAVTGAWAETITVVWDSSENSFDDRVQYSNFYYDEDGSGEHSLADGGTFTTSLGNFTKIEISGGFYEDYGNPGSGWNNRTWTGNASSVNSGILLSDDYHSEPFTITFTIEPTVAVTSIALAPTSATLTLGETETVTLIPTVLPAEATDKSVTWSSSDEAVATVTDGVVTAVAAGTATITVTTTDGAKTATCTVTVAAPAASTYTVTLKEGTEDATSWTIAPAEATTTGVAAGTTVTATYSGTKKVKSVKAVKKAAVPVTAITLNKTETSIMVGATETLSVTAVAPDNATDKTYTWKTSNASIATVDQDGKVTAVAVGTVTIYAEANDGSGVKGNCEVAVLHPATITVTWNNDDITDTWENSFTKDGVTITASDIDFRQKNFYGDGTFTTTLGNFTKIEVTTASWYASGTGWSGSDEVGTWTGNASSVSFSGNIMGEGEGTTTFVFTIELPN